MHYFLGADVGGTKTQVWVADEQGQVQGRGESGPGNHEIVGYAGLTRVLAEASERALAQAAIGRERIAAAGFGVAGLDWPSEREPILRAIAELGMQAPVAVVNDALIGLLAGSAEGWGVAVVSGTGCNCWGWDRTRQHVGQVTGSGQIAGEGTGAGELVARAMQVVAHAWTRRGRATQLTPAFVQLTGARDLSDLLEGLLTGRYGLDASAAPLVFQVAAAGDPVAGEVIRWAGQELGELANAVIRQLGFEALEFDVVLVGGMYNGGPALIEPLRQTVQTLAPRARLVRLSAPPVVGAVLLGMERAGADTTRAREALLHS